MPETLTQVIDRLVQEKTFNLDGITAVKALRDKATDQETQIEILKGKYDTQSNSLSKVTIEASDLRSQIAVAKQREDDLVNREKKVFELEKQTAVAQAQAHVYSTVFGTVFRNTIIREQTTKNHVVPPQYSGGPSMIQPATDTVTRESDPSF